MSEPMIPVKPEIQQHAHIRSMEEYQRLYRASIDSPEAFWGEQAQTLTWFHPWTHVLDADYEEVDFAWFSGGRLNACYNCVDRHLSDKGNQTALIWAADEPGVYRHITYREMKHHVCRMANVLLAQGVKKGDRVCLYMPMIPETAFMMLACARIGAIHSVVFGGFSAESLRDRLIDASCHVVVTANEGMRGGKRIPLKKIVDRAVEGMSAITTVLVARRTDAEVPMVQGRDLWLEEECLKQRSTCTVEWMGAEDPLFILYTSGSTGKPKGVMHTTGGYMVYAAVTHKLVFDYHPGDVYCCTADVGWVTGHTYLVYGPLANGATTVMFESVPTYPDAGRYWQMVDDLQINIFYTAPTALRAIAQAGNEPVTRASRASLRILGSVGEPINPEIWKWYHDVVGEGRCAVVDTWWQTETGGILITPLPGVTPTKPGSATLPFFGVAPVLVDPADGTLIEGNGVSGALCLTQPWPGQARTIWGDHRRFRATYFTQYPGKYFTGDGCTPRRGRLLLDHRPHRRRAQRLRPPPRHRRGGERPRRPRGRRRGRRGRLPSPHQGSGHLRVRGPRLRVRRHRQHHRLRSRSRCATPSGRSPRRTSSMWPPACPRPGAARSCGASSARSPTPSTRDSGT